MSVAVQLLGLLVVSFWTVAELAVLMGGIIIKNIKIKMANYLTQFHYLASQVPAEFDFAKEDFDVKQIY
jgi:hypothetical protein